MKSFEKFRTSIRLSVIVLPVCWFLLAACANPRLAGQVQPAQDPFSVLMRVYEGPLDHLSAVRRGQCPMHPSCLQYSKQAVSKHGPLMGWFMTTDRLMRCGRDEMKRSRRVRINGQWLYYDPVEENDSWLTGKMAPSHQKVD